MELYESGIRANDEQSSLVAKVMVSMVAAMAVIVVATVLAFHTGATIV